MASTIRPERGAPIIPFFAYNFNYLYGEAQRPLGEDPRDPLDESLFTGCKLGS